MRYERFRVDRDNLIFGQVSAELDDLVRSGVVRELSDTQLLTALCEARAGTRYRIALESELRRREAWAGPARYALIVSTLALLVALAALILTLTGLSPAGVWERVLLLL
jgi:hypothetical protein